MRPSVTDRAAAAAAALRRAARHITVLEIAAVLGFGVLSAYVWSLAVRQAAVTLVWDAVSQVASIPGIKLPASAAGATTREDLSPWFAAILVLYVLGCLYLSAQRARPLPSEEDVLSGYLEPESRPGARGGSR